MKSYKRIFIILVTLIAATTGAGAQGTTVWTTAVNMSELQVGHILAEGFSLTGGEFDNITFNAGRYKKDGDLKIQDEDLMHRFIDSFGENGVIKDKVDHNHTFAPVDEYGDDGNAWLVTKVFNDGTSTHIYLSGIYYDPNGVALTANDDRTVWTMTMPAADVELTVKYWDDATVGGTATAATDVRAGEDKALVSGLSAEGGSLVWAVTASTVTTAPADDQFAAAKNTAKDITEAGTYRVWYFAAGDASHSPSDPASIEVTVLTNKFDLTLTAANALTIESGKATVTVGDSPATVTNGKITGVQMGQTVKITAATGYKIVGATANDGSTVYNGEVAMSALKEGDILTEGCSVSGGENSNIIFDEKRHILNGNLAYTTTNASLRSFTIGENGVISIHDTTLAPVDGSNQDGNAWVVTHYEVISSIININFSGITYPTVLPLSDDKTEATLTMPASDVTVSYQLARDMEVSVTADIAERIRIQKDSESGEYNAVTTAELQPTVSDKISGTAVTMTENTDYTTVLQKKGDNDSWAEATALSTGTFRYAINGTGLYDGTIYTNEFELYEGYEVTVPAGGYITYYKDEPLRVDVNKTDARFYTVSSVTETTATLSGPYDAMYSNTPMLIYNGGNAPETVLLIPCTDPDLAVQPDPAPEFIGTLEAKTFTDNDMSGKQYYVLVGGKMFVRVEGAGTIAAHRCWLELPNNNTNAARSLVIIGNDDEPTSIENVQWSMVNGQSDSWYDLQGRKLEGQPKRKGVYIHNGKKITQSRRER